MVEAVIQPERANILWTFENYIEQALGIAVCYPGVSVKEARVNYVGEMATNGNSDHASATASGRHVLTRLALARQ